MYFEHYGLTESPFSITPDPRFVYLSERHRDALAHLLYGVMQGGGGGFVQLTGEVGTGKTTVCRLLLEKLPDNVRVALVLNPKLTPIELLETICDDLKIDLSQTPRTIRGLVAALYRYLLDAYAQGLRVILIVDEAQLLTFNALEQIRLLTNLETATQKLLQILLLGQPELRDMLAKPQLRQLAQRVTARFHLTPLNLTETEAYLRHRFATAGGSHFPFSKAAIKRIHDRAAGVPRLINVISERSLLAGYAKGVNTINEQLVDRAAQESMSSFKVSSLSLSKKTWCWALAACTAALVLTAVGVMVWNSGSEPVSSLAQANAATDSDRASIATAVIIDATQLREKIAAKEEAAPALIEAVWQKLAKDWQVQTSEADINQLKKCAITIAPGLFCLQGNATLDQLAAINRPARIVLQDGQRKLDVLLLGVDADYVQLWFDNQSIKIRRLDLQSLWPGEFSALWRGPRFIDIPLDWKNDKIAAQWLSDRLAERSRQLNLPSLTNDPADTESLETALRTMQRTHGLNDNGQVDGMTLLALSSIDANGPHLQKVLR